MTAGRRRGSAVLLGALLLGLLVLPARARDAPAADAAGEATIRPPELSVSVPAAYPTAALEAGREGSVLLRLTVAADGLVSEAEVVEPAGHGFDAAARAAALGFRFQPATRGGVPTAARILHRYDFRLSSERRVEAREPATRDDPPASVSPAGVGAGHLPVARLPEAATTAAPVEVTVLGASPAQAPGAVHVIHQRTLERYGYDDPHAVLQTAPGVYVRQEEGFGLRPNIGLRGASSDRSKKVTLMEDGVLFGPAPYSAPAAYYFPLMARIAEVRVIKGPAAIGYGPQSIGGAIDLATRPIPTERRGELAVAGGQYAYRNLHAWVGTRGDDGRRGLLLEGLHVGSGGFKELSGGGDTGFRRNEWVVKASHRLAPEASSSHELSVRASYADEISHETYLGLSDADFRRDPLRRYAASALDEMRWHRTGLVVTHEVRPRAKLELETSIYRHDLSRRWHKVNGFVGADLFDVLTEPDAPANAIYHGILTGAIDGTAPAEALRIGPNTRDYLSQGVQTRVAWSPRTGPFTHRLEYGLRLHYDRVDRRHTEQHYRGVDGGLVPVEAAAIMTSRNRAWAEAIALHASDAVTWRALTLTPGVRVELLRSTLDDHLAGTEARGSTQAVLPGVGAYLGLTEALGALAGAYRGFSPPAPGNSERLGPELSVNYELGLRYTDAPLRAELIGYYNDYSNLAELCTLSSGCRDTTLDRQLSVGAVRIYGLESHAAHEVSLGALRLFVTGAYTLTLTELRRSFVAEDPILGDVAAGDELPYVPRHQAHASLGLEGHRPAGYLAAVYVSRMRERPGNEPLDEVSTTDAQLVIDSGVSYRLTSWLRLRADVHNVLDRRNLVSRRPYGARPNAPRWVELGVGAQF